MLTNKKQPTKLSAQQTNYLIQKKFPKCLPLETCDLILNHVRSSCLNFAIQETPISVYLTLRKSFCQTSRSYSTSNKPSNLVESHIIPNKLKTELETLRKEFNILKIKSDNLEEANDELSRQLEEEVIESEHLTSELTLKTENLKIIDKKLEKI